MDDVTGPQKLSISRILDVIAKTKLEYGLGKGKGVDVSRRQDQLSQGFILPDIYGVLDVRAAVWYAVQRVCILAIGEVSLIDVEFCGPESKSNFFFENIKFEESWTEGEKRGRQKEKKRHGKPPTPQVPGAKEIFENEKRGKNKKQAGILYRPGEFFNDPTLIQKAV